MTLRMNRTPIGRRALDSPAFDAAMWRCASRCRTTLLRPSPIGDSSAF